jgi:hypothetical protein
VIHVWMNVAVFLVFAGLVAFAGCMGSTTFWGDE